MNLVTKYNSNVFLDENIKIFHVTCVLHDSRQSERMTQLQIENKQPIWLSAPEERKLTEIIEKIVKEKNVLLWAYNISGDHVHMILVCKEEELKSIVQGIKSMSARAFNIWKDITTPDKGACSLASKKLKTCLPATPTRGKTQNHLWAQKFNRKQITTEEQLFNTFQYIQLNRQKNGLSESKIFNKIIYGTTESFY